MSRGEAPTETDGGTEPDSDAGSRSGHDLDALRLTQSEARGVLAHQIQLFNDIDDKAARTFRLDAILLGLILTAASFVSRSQNLDLSQYVNAGTNAGVGLLVVSFVAAVITYSTTAIRIGLGPSDVHRLIDERYTETEWLVLLLRSEAAWMRRNDRQQTINGLLLTVSHVALIVAVVGFSFGVAAVYWF